MKTENLFDTEQKTVITPNGRVEVTINEFRERVIARAVRANPGFNLVNKGYNELFEKLLLYFWEDPQFESKGYGKLDKGICITGNVGVGKTFLIRLFQFNPRQNFKVSSCSEAVAAYQKAGLEALDEAYGQIYKGMMKIAFPAICFDDLGAERFPVNFMGSSINVMHELIVERYQREVPFSHTHFTTNLSGTQIQEFYGERIRSRLREMVNFLELKGTDRRK
jgi:hypothetical protein